jgi:serine/threonine-protein kinase HSL1 (negative regulator of Swe1 kinase)
MAPSRYANLGAARRTPLADASSKANSLTNPPLGKPAPGPPKLAENYKSHGKAKAQAENSNKNRMTGRSMLAIPAQDKRHSTASYSSRKGVSSRQVKSHIGPWQLGATVGHGGTCTVRKVRHARTGGAAVAKIISKVTAEKVRARSLANLSQRMETGDHHFAAQLSLPVGLEREIVIMRLLRHPNIVQLYDVWENSNQM